ncbi:MAG: hypothetical protein ACI9TY_000745 [Alphaproteobacteria bacterium]|jgi:hypothetical protein
MTLTLLTTGYPPYFPKNEIRPSFEKSIYTNKINMLQLLARFMLLLPVTGFWGEAELIGRKKT